MAAPPSQSRRLLPWIISVIVLLGLLFFVAKNASAIQAKWHEYGLVTGDEKARDDAGLSLTKLGAEGVAILAMAVGHEDPEVGDTATFYLSQLGPQAHTGTPKLIGFLSHEEYDIRIHAQKILESIGPKAIPPLIDTLSNEGLGGSPPDEWISIEIEPRWHASEALITIGSPAVLSLRELLESETPSTRKWAAWTLYFIEPDIVTAGR